MKKIIVFIISLQVLSGCVPVTEEMLKDAPALSQAVNPPYEGLDPGGKEQQTLHFAISAYGQQKAYDYGLLAERNYERIMHDTGLYSFRPKEPYKIVIYASREEFQKKTQQPEWSGGVTLGNAILFYDSEGAETVMTHEMSHVIYNEFMARIPEEQRWINEGLAVYEEVKTMTPIYREKYNSAASQLVKENPLPFSQMTNLVPATERERLVNKWYMQAGNVVQFMIENGGRLGFSIFLTQLKSGSTIDSAIANGFPGLWNDAASLEKAWLTYVSMY